MKRFLENLKEQWFPKGFRRTKERLVKRLIHRTTRRNLAASFTKLQIPAGSVICIHSALSELGYVVGGPENVVLALQDAVPGCTIMMPTFPIGASTLDYISSDPIYDVQRTRSDSGLLTETFRQMKGVHRSLHPTHPCGAIGPKTAELLDGSEASVTPFGDSSTYGRFSTRDDAILLLIHTNGTSIVHRFQEMVDMPNLFLSGVYSVRGYDLQGQTQTYSLKVHTPQLPLYIAIAAEGGGCEYMWFPDYVVQFPESNRQKILQRVRNTAAKQMLMDRQASFFEKNVFRRAKHGQAELLAVRVKPWQDRICRDLRQSLSTLPSCYAADALTAAKKQGLLGH